MRSDRYRALREAAFCAVMLLTMAVAPASAQQIDEDDPVIALFLRAVEIDERNARNPVFHAVVQSVGPLVTSHSAGEFFQHLLTLHTATFPVPTSGGSFTYVFDAATRTFSRQTPSFGPMFLDRAATIGRAGAWTAGVSYQSVRFDSLNGVPLSQAMAMTFRYVDGRVKRRTLSMDLESRTVVLFGTVGLTRDLDAMVVVPTSTISYRGVIDWGDGTSFDTGDATSTSLGDLETRLKWTAWRSRRFEVGARYALRLPTGKDAIHSLERAQQKLTGLLSASLGGVTTHLNVGYVFRVAGETPGSARRNLQPDPFGPESSNPFGFLPSGSLSNEANYGVGVEWPAHPRLTVTGEFIGRSITDTIRFDQVTGDFTQPDPFDPTAACCYYLTSMRPFAADMHIGFVSAGAKYQLIGQSLLSFQILVPVTSEGLKPGVSATVGWEVGF
jgi:hypothetical protein